MSTPAPDLTARLGALHDGWIKAMRVRLIRVTHEEVVAELDVGPTHLQPLGIVHGGVYAGFVEATTSLGAGASAYDDDLYPVGLENHTSFLHAVRRGTLRAIARPLTLGRRTQVWEAAITDASGRLAATGRVRFLMLARGAPIGGEGASLEAPIE